MSTASSIVDHAPASFEEWDRTWARCPSATYFHSRHWAESWRVATGGRMRPAPDLLALRSGATVLLPLTRQRLRRGLNHRFLASPAGTYGGWLTTTRLGPDQRDAVESWLLAERRPLIWRRSPFDPEQFPRARAAGDDEVTHALDLSDGLDAVHRLWIRGGGATLRKARRAERSGVTVRIAETESDWRAYFALYQRSLARWGDRASSRYDWALFDAIRGRRSGFETLWLAERDGALLAGALCLAAPRVVSYWHGAADAESFSLRPVNLLLCRAIESACAHGAHWFDFGPSGSHEGVAAFKRSFRATPLPCPLVRTRTRTQRLLDRLHFASAP